jgi:hypothetical protein
MFILLKHNHRKVVMELQKNTLCILKEVKSILKANIIWLVDMVSI